MITATKSQELRKMLAAEAAKEHWHEEGEGGENQEMMIRFWQAHRPRLFKALQLMGMTKTFARILSERAGEEFYNNKDRLGPSDSLEQSEQNWYLMDEETEQDDPAEVIEAVLKRASRWGKVPFNRNPSMDETTA
jgi:hypothetical protein